MNHFLIVIVIPISHCHSAALPKIDASTGNTNKKFIQIYVNYVSVRVSVCVTVAFDKFC